MAGYWDWFKSNHDEIRTLALIAAAVGGFGFAWWRAWIADRQATTAERTYLNERYRNAASMLGG